MAATHNRSELQTQLIDLSTYIFKYFLIFIYFLAWTIKSHLRRHLRFGLLAFLSLSNLLLAMELVLEWKKPIYIEYIIHEAKEYSDYLFIALILAIVYLFYDHLREVKHRGHEYTFVKHVLAFLRSPRPAHTTEDACIQGAVELFYGCFKRARIVCTSVHKAEGDSLRIKDIYTYPQATHPAYFLPLSKGFGVAGRVFDDGNPRYLPRLYFPFAKRGGWLPTAYFPHGVIFEVQGVEKNQYQAKASKLDFFIFQTRPPSDPCEFCHTQQWQQTLTGRWFCGQCRKRAPLTPSDRMPFRSLLSVPVKFENETRKTSYGVLNFDFARHDPLDASDVAMAVTFGILLAEELARLGWR